MYYNLKIKELKTSISYNHFHGGVTFDPRWPSTSSYLGWPFEEYWRPLLHPHRRTQHAAVTRSRLFRSVYNVIQNCKLCVRLVKFHVMILLFVAPHGLEYGYKDLATNKCDEGCKLLRNVGTICRTTYCLKREPPPAPPNMLTQSLPHIICAALRVSCSHT